MFSFMRDHDRGPIELPLFPLHTVLYPGGLLPLKVFEQRYVEMTKTCLSGEKPFGGNLDAVTYKICHEDPEPPSKHSALKLPVEVDQLIATALAKEPAARFQDARAFNEALREVAQMSVAVDDGGGTTMVNIGTLMLQKPAPAWDDETLRTAEHELARALGPMAKLIVRKAAAQTHDRLELCSILADNILDPEERRKFVKAFTETGSGVRASASGISGARVTTGSSPSTPSRPHTGAPASLPGSTAGGAPPEPAFVEQITAQLAVYIGPIAPIVTKRAAREAKNRTDFLRRVADSLGTQDRASRLVEQSTESENIHFDFFSILAQVSRSATVLLKTG